MPTIGVCTSVSNAQKLDAAGYDYIEEKVQGFLQPFKSDSVFAEQLVKAQESPVPIKAFAWFLPGHLKCVGPEPMHDQIAAYAHTAFDRARQVGGPIIVFGSGGARRVPDGFNHDKAIEQFTDLLKKLGPIAAHYDITIAVEPLNRRECNLLNTIEAGAEIMRAVDHPNVRLVADIYHMAMEDEGPESILDAGSLIVHVHIAEKQGRTRPGAGGYDFVPYFTALHEIGYAGGISLECRWDDFDQELPDALAYVQQQLEAVWRP